MTKYDKADKLRKDCNADSARVKKIVNEWDKAVNKASSMQEKQEIDQMYQGRVSSCEKKEDRSYEAYYRYVHSAFHKDDIDKAVRLTRNFTSLRFIKILQMLDQKRMKKGRQSS